jgi:hypothetical protein
LAWSTLTQEQKKQRCPQMFCWETGGRNNKDEVCDDDKCIKLTTKNSKPNFTHTTYKIKNRRRLSHVPSKSTWHSRRRFASPVDDIPIFGLEISAGYIAGQNEASSKFVRSTVVLLCFSSTIILGMFPLEHKNSWREEWGGPPSYDTKRI